MIQVFDFTDYRGFLTKAMEEQAKQRKGARARFATAIGCQPSYVSQVLKGISDINLEQADRANRYLGHGDEQSEYFLLLVAIARAGTSSLRNQLFKKAKREQSQYWTLRKRLQTKKELSPAAQQIYYSSWHYSAVAMALTVPTLRTPEAIAERFRLPVRRVSEILEFLSTIGIAQEKQGRFFSGASWIHVGETELARRNDLNWRLKSIQSLETKSPMDFRYSSVVSLSEADCELVRIKLIQVVEEIRKTVRDSKEEKVSSLIIDFFDV